MDGSSHSSSNLEAFTNNGEDSDAANLMSIEQLQRLVRLLDRSDVSELELKHAATGTRLVLRKAKATESNGQPIGLALPIQHRDASAGSRLAAPTIQPKKTKHTIVAHLVGIFHVSAKPKGGALVGVGDH